MGMNRRSFLGSVAALLAGSTAVGKALAASATDISAGKVVELIGGGQYTRIGKRVLFNMSIRITGAPQSCTLIGMFPDLGEEDYEEGIFDVVRDINTGEITYQTPSGNYEVSEVDRILNSPAPPYDDYEPSSS